MTAHLADRTLQRIQFGCLASILAIATAAAIGASGAADSPVDKINAEAAAPTSPFNRYGAISPFSWAPVATSPFWMRPTAS